MVTCTWKKLTVFRSMNKSGICYFQFRYFRHNQLKSYKWWIYIYLSYLRWSCHFHCFIIFWRRCVNSTYSATKFYTTPTCVRIPRKLCQKASLIAKELENACRRKETGRLPIYCWNILLQWCVSRLHDKQLPFIPVLGPNRDGI